MRLLQSFVLVMTLATPAFSALCAEPSPEQLTSHYSCHMVDKKTGSLELGGGYEIFVVDSDHGLPTYKLMQKMSGPKSKVRFLEDAIWVDPTRYYLLHFKTSDLYARYLGQTILIWDDSRTGACQRYDDSTVKRAE